jgi:predicted glycosyltransferase
VSVAVGFFTLCAVVVVVVVVVGGGGVGHELVRGVQKSDNYFRAVGI